jgi:hypothetical protein
MARVNVSAEDWVRFRGAAIRQQRSVDDYLGELAEENCEAEIGWGIADAAAV